MLASPTVENGDRAQVLIALAARYCWDSEPTAALRDEDRVILRVMDVGTWEDLLELERVFGQARLVGALRAARAGALTPRSWTFWHYRLGLANADAPPPPQPQRRVG